MERKQNDPWIAPGYDYQKGDGDFEDGCFDRWKTPEKPKRSKVSVTVTHAATKMNSTHYG